MGDMAKEPVKWPKEKIIAEFKKLMEEGVEHPDIYELKKRCGYEKCSEFFFVLKDIEMFSEQGLSDFVAGIFFTVTDERDLNYCHGECHCDYCRGD